MRKNSILLFFCLAICFFAASACSGGFSGPGTGTNFKRGESVTVNQLNTINGKARVKLMGNIIQAQGREYYTFQDATGSLVVEIERNIWWGKSIAPSDTVEITVKAERKRDGRIEAEVKRLRKA